MINTVTVRNFRDEEMTITLNEAEPAHGLIIKNITGLGPANAVVNMSDFVTDDGSVYNSARLEKRTIEFTLLLAFAPDIETSRQNTYKYFPIKKPVTLIFDTTNRYAQITGYVEKNEPDIFSKQESQTISIVCGDPYFYSANGKNVTEFGAVDALFEFPFENESLTENTIIFSEYSQTLQKNVYYDGDGEAGIVMHIHAYGDVGNISIYNYNTQERMIISSDKIEALTGTKLTIGDELIISTVHKSKYARLLREGKYTNILNAIDRKLSSWFILTKGDNIFAYVTDDGTDHQILFSIENDVLYEGL